MKKINNDLFKKDIYTAPAIDKLIEFDLIKGKSFAANTEVTANCNPAAVSNANCS